MRCKACSAVRTDPPPYADEAAAEAIYSEDKEGYYERNKDNFYAGARLVIEELTAVAKVQRLIDVGCGPGTFVRFGRDAGIEVWGIDINAQDIGYCQAQGLGEWVRRLPVNRLALELGRFDGAILNHVLEHTTDPVRFLELLRGALVPGAAVAVAVPDFASPSRMLLRQKWYGLQPDTHVYHFERATLSATLNEAGFEVVSMKSRTTLSTTYHAHRAQGLHRRLYAQSFMRLGEYLGHSDQLIAVATNAAQPRDSARFPGKGVIGGEAPTGV